MLVCELYSEGGSESTVLCVRGGRLAPTLMIRPVYMYLQVLFRQVKGQSLEQRSQVSVVTETLPISC